MFDEFTFINGLNLVLGFIFGIIISAVITVLVFSKHMKKINKDKRIRDISNNVYENIYLTNTRLKDKFFRSLRKEIKETSKLVFEDKENAIYELSINEIFDGLNIVQEKMLYTINNPLLKDVKHMKVSSILSIKKMTEPLIKIYKNKAVKVLRIILDGLLFVINLINPIYYARKIINKIALKNGKKNLFIIGLDVVGNTTYQIYDKAKKSNK